MTTIRKLPAGAGAEWLIGGLTLLRRSPMGLGTLGLVFGLLGLLANLSLQSSPDVAMVLQLVFIVLGPLLLAGMVYAAREVDAGRPATPGHLLRGLQDGKAGRLLATLLPQVVAVVLLVVLLYVLIGPSEIESMAATLEKLQGQAKPDPSLVATLPVRRILLWLAIAVAVGILTGFFTFTALPEMMFTDRGAFAAMGTSFQACLRNLPAMLVFFLLTAIAAVALQILVLLLAAVIGAIAGQFAMQVVVQLVTMAVLMPVITGAMYVAWKQMHGDAGTGVAPPAFHGIEA
ncbi:BPSS1780 family membrane protein [Lysobacter xanthus]